MDFLWKITVISVITLVEIYSSVVGRYYSENIPFGARVKYPRGSDPCNPLYWYPRPIPDYYFKKPEQPVRVPLPLGPIPLPPGPMPLSPAPMVLPPVPLFSLSGPIPLPPSPIPYPQVSVPLPSGPIPYPQVSVPLPSGPIPYPQVSVPLPSGPIPYPQVSVPLPSGPIPQLQASVSLPSGPIPQPQGPIPLPSGPILLSQNSVPMISNPPLHFTINPSQMSYGPYGFLHPLTSYQIPIPNGPVNILPFSDVYSDLMAKRSFRRFMKKHSQRS